MNSPYRLIPRMGAFLILFGLCGLPACLGTKLGNSVSGTGVSQSKILKTNQIVTLNGSTVTPFPTLSVTRQLEATSTPEISDTGSDQNMSTLADIPDGEYILIVDQWGGEKDSLKIIDLNGNLIGILIAGEYYRDARISPDDKWLAFVDGSSTDNASLYIKSLVTGDEQKIDEHCTQVSWSKSAQFLAAGCNSQIEVFKFDNANWKQIGVLPQPYEGFNHLSPGRIEYYSPSWSPDSSKLVYFGRSILTGKIENIGPFISTTFCLLDSRPCKTTDYRISGVDDLTWSHSGPEIYVHQFINGISSLIFYDTTKNLSVKKKLHLVESGYTIESMVFSQDDSQIAFRPDTNGVFIYDFNTKKSRFVFEGDGYSTLQVLDWISLHRNKPKASLPINQY